MRTAVPVLLAAVLNAAATCHPQDEALTREIQRGGSPTALAFDRDGRLLVSDRAAGTIERCSGDECVVLGEPLHRPFGVVVTADDRVCAAHYDTEDPLHRRAVVSWHDGAGWRVMATVPGQGVNGLAVDGDGIWVAAWMDSPAAGRDGRLVHIVDGGVQRVTELPERVPQFLVVLPGGDLVVSVWHEDAAGVSGGELIRVSADDRVRSFGPPLRQPTGLAVGRRGVLAVDYATGELALISESGERMAVHRGLSRPLGIAVHGDVLCIAESGAGRVTCRSVDQFLQPSP